MNEINGCVLVPAYNEEKHIQNVIQRASQFLPVLVVDDGSIDKTAANAEKAGAVVYRQTKNQGKGAALQRGFAEAMSSGYEFVITLDADGQHDPVEIPSFVEAYQQKQYDLVIGYRDFKRMPWIRRISNSSGGLAFSWAVGQKIRDNQSGYRLMSRSLLELVLDSNETGFEFEVEVIVICIQSGKKMGWVPIQTIYADEVSHIRPIHHFVNFLRIVRKTRQRMRRFYKR